jgi:hypothetical protein
VYAKAHNHYQRKVGIVKWIESRPLNIVGIVRKGMLHLRYQGLSPTTLIHSWRLEIVTLFGWTFEVLRFIKPIQKKLLTSAKILWVLDDGIKEAGLAS